MPSRHRLLLRGYFAFRGWKLLCVCRGHFAHPLPRRLRACQRTGMSVKGAQGQKQPHMHRRCSVMHLHPAMQRRGAERPVPETASHIQTCRGVPALSPMLRRYHRCLRSSPTANGAVPTEVRSEQERIGAAHRHRHRERRHTRDRYRFWVGDSGLRGVGPGSRPSGARLFSPFRLGSAT